ncbi:MAG TPA: hypothetical protein VF157_02800 [Chloroflexota bacterium]
MREQVDVAHQREYCFTEAHRRCPWLSVPPEGHKPADRTLPKGKIAAGGGVAALLCGVAAMLLTGMPAFGGGQSGVHQGIAGGVVAAVEADAHSRPTPAAKTAPDVLQPFGALAPELLQTSAPRTVSATLDSAAGGTVLAGNVGLSFSPRSLSEMGDSASVHVEAQPKANVPGGPAQFSPSGTIVDISVRDQAGKLVTTFPEPVDILFKYNAADLAMAHGDASQLRAAYVIDDDSPELENPNHFPVNTWVFFPPSNLKVDTDSGTVSVSTQAIGSIFSVVAVGVGWAQTVRDTQLYSSFDPARSTVFGTLKQGAYVRMVEPQIGSRLLVLNVATGNYAYMNVRDLKPSDGPPGQY